MRCENNLHTYLQTCQQRRASVIYITSMIIKTLMFCIGMAQCGIQRGSTQHT